MYKPFSLSPPPLFWAQHASSSGLILFTHLEMGAQLANKLLSRKSQFENKKLQIAKQEASRPHRPHVSHSSITPSRPKQLFDGACDQNAHFFDHQKKRTFSTSKNEKGETVNTRLKNALYIPSFPQDIFSVNSAVEQGAEVKFGKDASVLIAEDGTKFHVSKRGKLFFIDHVKIVKCEKSNVNTSENVAVGKACSIPKKTHSLNQ